MSQQIIRSFGYNNNSVRIYSLDGLMSEVVLNEGTDREDSFVCLNDSESNIKLLIDAMAKGDIF